ncbi:MAG TPA: DinB family protein, partial [Candidatus Eisenbacteria bacterium]|nr:DinB family protein [Candidatus Eisenbacteria bacterium]
VGRAGETGAPGRMGGPMDLNDYFAATWAAREKLLDACEELTPEEWTREFPFSWKSLRNLMAHIIEVEDSWIAADIEGRAWTSLDEKEVARRYETPKLARARGQKVAAATKRVLATFVPSGLKELRTGKALDGSEVNFTVEQILTHVFTHELRHQGQIQAMLRLLGKKAPNADWI